MVALKSANISESFEHLKLLQQRVLLLKDTVIQINKTQLNFLKKQVINNILEICKGKHTERARMPNRIFYARVETSK